MKIIRILKGMRRQTLEKAVLCVLCAFSGISALYSIRLKNLIYVLSSFMSLLLLLLPLIAERWFSVRISCDLKAAYYFLVVGGPVLGNVYKFYHYIRPWDKILHFTSGFAIAALGYALSDLAGWGNGKGSVFFMCLFAFCFSMAASAVWEIYEYALDVFFKMDMQNDTVITEIASYMIGDEPGTIGIIENIELVHLNGEPFEYGYIDIGLIDTMKDMILCALGACAFCMTAFRKKKHPNYASIRRVPCA